MIISVGTSSLKQTRWWEYAMRFALGGLVTAGAGMLAKVAGESVAGLFLAFPAILAASTTLVARHERERKEQRGERGDGRGKAAAGADAIGAVMGSLGLITFAVIVWRLLPGYSAWAVIAGATFAWGVVSGLVWWVWKKNTHWRIRAVDRVR